jgi:putative endonuclease
MQFLKKDGVGNATTKARGDAGEDEALAYLQERGLRLLQRNYRTPGRGGGEIDLIMQTSDGTVVFVEVRKRSRSDFGGAAASVSFHKQRRIVLAAQHYLMRWRRLPPTRFDVISIEAQGPQWLQAAFDAA